MSTQDNHIGIDHDEMIGPTPGPWTVVDSTQVYLCQDGPQVHIADCVGHTQKGLFAGQMHAANARLIAAAPDLLSALETLMNMPEWARLQCVSAEFVRAHDAADDAIRKARGQQNMMRERTYGQELGVVG